MVFIFEKKNIRHVTRLFNPTGLYLKLSVTIFQINNYCLLRLNLKYNLKYTFLNFIKKITLKLASFGN